MRKKLIEILEDAFDRASRKYVLEAFGEIYTNEQIRARIDEIAIKEKSLNLIIC